MRVRSVVIPPPQFHFSIWFIKRKSMKAFLSYYWNSLERVWSQSLFFCKDLFIFINSFFPEMLNREIHNGKYAKWKAHLLSASLKYCILSYRLYIKWKHFMSLHMYYLKNATIAPNSVTTFFQTTNLFFFWIKYIWSASKCQRQREPLPVSERLTSELQGNR